MLISGGTSGIGLEAAREFLQEGARVCLMGRSAERGQAAVRLLQREARGADDVDVCFVAGDVRSKADCSRVVREMAERFGGLDVLVNSAGIYHEGALEDLREEELDDLLACNVKPFSGGSKGGILFGKRIPPLPRVPTAGGTEPRPLWAKKKIQLTLYE